MIEEIEQNYSFITTECLYSVGQDYIKTIKWMAHYVNFDENINFFDLMASVLSCPNEIYYW